MMPLLQTSWKVENQYKRVRIISFTLIQDLPQESQQVVSLLQYSLVLTLCIIQMCIVQERMYKRKD